MDETAEKYLRFARREAAGRSPLYETLAIHVAHSALALNFLERLPVARRQPNLLFAAIGHVAGTPTVPEALDQALVDHGAAIAQVMSPGRLRRTNPVVALCFCRCCRGSTDQSP